MVSLAHHISTYFALNRRITKSGSGIAKQILFYLIISQHRVRFDLIGYWIENRITTYMYTFRASVKIDRPGTIWSAWILLTF